MKKKTYPQSEKITVDGYTFASGELEWARQNLPAIQRSARSNTVLYFSMAIAFVLGLALYLLGYVISIGGIAMPPGWRDDLIANLLTELGVTLWTSVILVLFLEVIVEIQRKRWQRYARTVEHALQQQASQVSSDLDSDAEPEAIIARLDEVIERLAGLDSLRADVNVLKARWDSSE